MKYITSKRGFTLIELMAVVVILGIVATVAIPSLYKYKKAAEEGERFELEKNINKALIGYYAYRGEYPSINRSAGDEPLTPDELGLLNGQLEKVTGTSFQNTVLNYENKFEFYIKTFPHAGVGVPFRIKVTLKSPELGG